MDLSDFFITKSQATDFSVRLTAIIDALFTTGFDLEKALVHQFGIEKKDKFLKLMRQENLTNTSIDQLQTFLTKIQETITQLPVVSVTIAFEPTNETLKALSQWFLFTLNKHVVFEIATDTHIVAGATITYNGKFKDYSLRTIFEKLYQATSTPQVRTIAQQTIGQPHPNPLLKGEGD